MSDLSTPDERPPSPPVARRTRPKTKASTPRRAIKPAALPTAMQSAAKPTPPPAKAPDAKPAPPAKASNAKPALPAKQPEVIEQPEPEGVETPADRFTYSVRNWTITSKPILLWAVIVGVGSMIVYAGPSLVLTAFGVTPKDLDNNPDLEGALGWGSFILTIAVPVVGGWRATIREGNWKQGGMTGFWGNVVFTLLLLIYTVIDAAYLKQLDKITGDFFVSLFLEGILFQGILSFGLGTMGGWYSTWQRRRAQRAQEMLASSS